MSPLRLYNTNTRTLEVFAPASPPAVTMYNCGPTVYNFAHIGNLRAFVFADLLRRTLEWNGYEVTQIMNITDVGHLVSDADEGEDKMEKGARREGVSARTIAERYEEAFHNDLRSLHVEPAERYPRATEHIREQIDLIVTLEQKGYTYGTSDGIYFDTAKFPEYGKMAHLDLSGQREGARVETNEEKHNPADFALWKFSPKDGLRREQEWESPWGVGFPGWHVECSAMAMHYLGQTIDIHTGGIDHIPVHHTNEIAQSECATGKPFARFWMHSAFMNVDGQKMSKSLGNTYTLSDLAARGVTPVGFRYWLLTAHYRTLVNFTDEALFGAQKRITELMRQVAEVSGMVDSTIPPDPVTLQSFNDALADDIGTPRALALLNETAKDLRVPGKESVACATILRMDTVLGLGFADALAHPETFTNTHNETVTDPALLALLDARTRARETKDWSESDRLRDLILSAGYIVKDTAEGQQVSRV